MITWVWSNFGDGHRFSWESREVTVTFGETSNPLAMLQKGTGIPVKT